MELLFLIILIVLNGVLAMSEIAIVAARAVSLSNMAEAGDKAAATALRMHHNPTDFLSTVQVGITSIGILNGIVGEAVLARPIAMRLQELGMDAAGSGLLATTLVVVVITYATIVIGELVPKRIAQINPEAIARLVARPMQFLSWIAHPFVKFLTLSTETVIGLLRLNRQRAGLTEEDIKALVTQVSEEGEILHQENQLVRNVFRLDDRLIKSLMTHRKDIICLDLQQSRQDNLNIVRNSDHIMFPVCDGGLGNVLGVVHSKDLLFQLEQDGEINLSLSVRAAVFLPETLNGIDLLNHFSTSRNKMALVVNEYGELQGLVTAQDVLNALVGEISDEITVEKASRQEDDSWILDGLIALPEVMDLLGWKSLPESGRGDYHTLSGLVLQLLEHLPEPGNRVKWEDWMLEILELDGKRASKVRATYVGT